jgi:hypothetical protein
MGGSTTLPAFLGKYYIWFKDVDAQNIYLEFKRKIFNQYLEKSKCRSNEPCNYEEDQGLHTQLAAPGS